MNTYTTIQDLTDQAIVPALEGVEPNFDVVSFVQTLRDRDLVVWTGSGFELILDEDGVTPGFADLVAEFDAAAMERVIVIGEDPHETMAMAGLGPEFTAEAIALADSSDITDEEWDRLEAIREAQRVGEDDYFERWAEQARAEALKLGYRAEVVRASQGSMDAARVTDTAHGTVGHTVEEVAWQAAHDATDLPDGWDR